MLSTSQNTVLPLEPNTNTITNNSFNAAPGALNSDLLSPVQTRLQAIASSDDFFTRVFGEKANTAEIQAIRSQWAVGDFSIFPKLQIVDAAVMGEAFGAYSQTNQTIYLSDALLANGVDDCMFGATGVLIEETFHWLDSLVGDDTPGDEGELARHLIFGVTPNGEELARIGAEQDQGLLWLNGQATPVELSSDFAGNTFASARNITLGSTPTTFSDWVGSIDTLDYYRFTLNQASVVNFSLTGLSADAHLGLLDANGRWLAWDWRSGTASENITRELNAGTYFIEVRQGSGFTNYNLTASATAVPDLAGNTFASARNITLGSTPTTFSDWVGSIDTLDYYRFTLNQASVVNFSLTGLSADAHLGLLDANGRWLAWDWRSGTASENITRELNAGTYFIEVRQGSGFTNYNLTASATAVPDLAGNTFASARNITLGSTPTTFSDWVGSIDTLDYYRFTLNQASVVNFSLTGLSADAHLGLLDANGRWLAWDWRSGTASENITRELNAGTYFIEVRQGSGFTNYNLTASATPILPVVTIQATDATAAETNPGQTPNPGRFTLTRTGSTTNALTVNYTISGTATNGSDFNRLTGTVTFAAGASTAFIDINPINDSEFEDPETVVLTLANSSAYQIGNSSSATVTIWDNDLPTVTIQATDATAAETNPGQTPNPGRFTLTRTGSTTNALTVNYSIGGTAIGGTGSNADYTIGGTSTSVNFTNRMGTVTFAAGSSTAVIDINPIDDTLVEPSETVILTLLGSATYQIGTSNTATVTILDNDVPTVIISPNIIQGTLRADTFTYTPIHARTVFIGNGNVDYGAGRRDEIDLSTVSYGTVTFNLANTNGGGVVFNPGNGNRIFDALTLNNGKEILFEGIERIRFADRTLDLSVTPNDPLFNQQWNLHMIGVHHAWRFTTGSSNVLIGIQDSGLGVDSQNNVHPEIRTTTILPSNYRDEFGKPSSHGTAVQGIIAAKSNNGSGIAGINWNSNVFHIDVLGGNLGDQSLAQAAQNMINEARKLGQKLVINMSLSTWKWDAQTGKFIPTFGENIDQQLEEIVSNNKNKDEVLFVISSGNKGHLGKEGIASPAFLAKDNHNVMAVGAVHGTKNADGQATTPGTRIEYSGWWGSQYGTGLTLMAPSEVYTTKATRNPTGSVSFSYDEKFNGTSAAAPHVTGVASLIWSVNPNLTAAQLKTIMSETAYKGVPGYSEHYYGKGVVNADAAVRRAMAMARGSA